MICKLTTDTLQDQRSSHTPPQSSPEPTVNPAQREAPGDPKSAHGNQTEGSRSIDNTTTRKIVSRSTEQILNGASGPPPNHLKVSRTKSNNVIPNADDGGGGSRRAVSPVSIPFHLSPADSLSMEAVGRPLADHRSVGPKLSVGGIEDRGHLGIAMHHPLRQSRSHMSTSGGILPQYFPDAFGNNTLDNRKPIGPTPSSYSSQDRPQSRQTYVSGGPHLQAKRSVPGAFPAGRPLDHTPQTQSLHAGADGHVFHQKQQSWPMAVPGPGSFTSSSQTISSRGPTPLADGHDGQVTNYPYHRAQPIPRRYALIQYMYLFSKGTCGCL